MAKKKQILLPKGYLSWSQLNLWETRRKEYIKKYFYGEDTFVSKEMRFGKTFAEAMDGKEVEDQSMIGIIQLAERYDVMEKKIEVGFKTEFGIIPLLGFLDTYASKTHAFREYKTGKTKWTQNRADKLGQVDFYALLIYLKFKVLSPKIHLDWFETMNSDDGGIELTGNMESFHTEKTLGNLMQMGNLIKRVSCEITREYRKHMEELS